MPSDIENDRISRTREEEERQSLQRELDKFSGKSATASELLADTSNDEPLTAEELVAASRTPPKFVRRSKTSKLLRRVGAKYEAGSKYYKKNLKGSVERERSKLQSALTKSFMVRDKNGRAKRIVINKNQYRSLRQRGVKPTPYSNSDNIGEIYLRNEQTGYDRKEDSRRRNTIDVNFERRLVALRKADIERNRDYSKSEANNMLQSHKRLLTSKENQAIFIEENSILNDDYNFMKNPNINIMQTGRPSILQTQTNSLKFSNINEMNPLNAPKLNFGSIDLTNSNTDKKTAKSRKKINSKLSFWK